MKANLTTQKEVILGLVKIVRKEIENRKKKLSASDDFFVNKIMDVLQTKDKVFATEDQHLHYWKSMTRKVLWLEANTEESNEIINRLKSGDASFTENFFYGTKPNECNISRLRSTILSRIKENYKLEISVKEFGDILYAFLWDNGAWSLFDKYSLKSSIFSWLAVVSRNELMRSLKGMKIINVNCECAAGNTYNVEVSDELPKAVFCMWQEENNTNPLSDVFGVGLDEDELHEKVLEFLYAFPKKLKWTEEERIVWTSRFIENTPPVEVADRIGRTRSWVDTKFSRLNARFNKAVREWWLRNAV